MNKNIIALAVAAAVAAPAAFAEVKIGGVMHYSWDFTDTNNVAPADDSDDVTGNDRSSRIRFSGSEDLGDGLSAIWQVETQINANTGGFAHRNTFVGLKGGWGQIRAGRHDTPYKIATGKLDVFGDTAADYNNVVGRVGTAAPGSANSFDLRVAGTVAYISPVFNGFHGAIARVGVKAAEGAGADETEAWSLMGMYENGPLFASLAYETHSGGVATSPTTGEEDGWKLGLGYKFGASKIGFVYEDIDNDAAASASDREAYYLNFAHKFGANTFKVAYGNLDDSEAGANTGADTWALGIDHAFSKRTSAYALYTTMDNDTGAAFGINASNSGGSGAAGAGLDVDVFSVGLKHVY